MPTSGILTSQICIFGRRTPSGKYRLIVATNPIEADVSVNENGNNLVFQAGGKNVLIVPFDIIASTPIR